MGIFPRRLLNALPAIQRLGGVPGRGHWPINPAGGRENCLACCLAMIKTADTGQVHVASPRAPAGSFAQLVANLAMAGTTKTAAVAKGFWHHSDIERWLERSYPRPGTGVQHFLIAAIPARMEGPSHFDDGHALYGYRHMRQGRTQTTVVDPQHPLRLVAANTYKLIGATMIDPEKITPAVLRHYKIVPSTHR